jgi:hypothetical protein
MVIAKGTPGTERAGASPSGLRRLRDTTSRVVAEIREETRREPRLPGIFRLVP